LRLTTIVPVVGLLGLTPLAGRPANCTWPAEALPLSRLAVAATMKATTVSLEITSLLLSLDVSLDDRSSLPATAEAGLRNC
jgi:hypothetical protein